LTDFPLGFSRQLDDYRFKLLQGTVEQQAEVLLSLRKLLTGTQARSIRRDEGTRGAIASEAPFIHTMALLISLTSTLLSLG
jgi:hypothetical protein